MNNKQMEDRISFLEAELARRDAAAGEPVACLYASGDVLTRAECNDDRTFAVCCKVESPLYAAPQPAVLPPEMSCVNDDKDLLGQAYIAGYNRAIAAAKSLGCQPPKEFVVKAPFLPHDCDRTEAHYKYISAIKAAGGSIAGE